mgnify:CR=1 FL=1
MWHGDVAMTESYFATFRGDLAAGDRKLSQ